MKSNTFVISLLFFNLFFNCRKIALQCCVGFCHKQFESAVVTQIPLPSGPPPSPLHCSRSSQDARLGSLLQSGFPPPSVSHVTVDRCQRYFFQSSYQILPQLTPRNNSLHLYLHSFPANRFINTIFLDSV